jgi:hypothetical protein
MAALSSLVFLPAMVFHCPRGDTVQEFERPSYLACILASQAASLGWGWEDGYLACNVGDKVTAEVIRRSGRQHHFEKIGDAQLSRFE